MEEYVRNLVAAAVIGWGSGFIVVRKIFPKRSFDFCGRIISTIHAVFAVTLAVYSISDWSCPVCPLSSNSSPSQMRTLAVTLGYLIYDMLCCLSDMRVNVDNAIHHLVGIIGIGAGLIYQWCGSEMVATLCITEMSTPLLHLRELLKEMGYKDTHLNFAADIAFAVIFSLARMVLGPFLVYYTVTAPNPLLIKATAVGLQVVSGFWFYKIVRMVRYKLAKHQSSS